jgi:hypothetical protein
MYLSKVLRVLYSPRKTLKEVIQEPRYVGPLLIMILLIAVSVGSTYVVLTKEYYQQILPNGAKLDEWTENSTLWTSNANIVESSDSISGAYYGNASIAFSIQNSSQVWMNLTGIGTADCSVPNGYDNLTFRVKWTDPMTKPENVTIQVYSANSSSEYSYNDITDKFSDATYDVWNNLTDSNSIALASTGWSIPGADASFWGNITGLRLQFTWAGNSNVTILIDGLFFLGPFKSLLETSSTSLLANYGVLGAMQYAVTWIVLSGVIYILVKALRGKLVWRPLLIAVGFILMTMFVGALITTIVYSTLPTLRNPFELFGGVHGEGQAALNTISDQTSLATQIITVSQYLLWIWTAAMASLITRLMAEFSWAKSILVGTLAYLTTIIVVNIVLAL